MPGGAAPGGSRIHRIRHASGMSSPAVAPYGAFATADGRTVVLGTTNDREWRRL
ncbi:CoA transferase, partial [Nocardia sp.]|uniref:CoA transferase n=1 Tax=Nocardia sp. TaxID=1821 RepID=UPI0025895239